MEYYEYKQRINRFAFKPEHVYDLIDICFVFFIDLIKDFEIKISSKYSRLFDSSNESIDCILSEYTRLFDNSNNSVDSILPEYSMTYDELNTVFNSKILYKYLIETCKDINSTEVIALTAPPALDKLKNFIYQKVLNKYKKSDVKQYIAFKYKSTRKELIKFYENTNNVVRYVFPVDYTTETEGNNRYFVFKLKKQKRTMIDKFFVDVINEVITPDDFFKEMVKRNLVDDFLNSFSNDMSNEHTISDFFDDILNELDTIYEELMEAVSEEITGVSTTNTEIIDETTTKASIVIPNNILDWLATKKCSNGKCFIESATKKPYKWLQSKQNARVFLTHEVIKGNLTIEEVKRQAFEMFIYKNNQPLALANNDNRLNNNTDTDLLKSFLDKYLRDTTTCQTLK
jgi:hypothetical protein